MTKLEAYNAILARMITFWHTKVGGTQAAPTVPYAIDNRKLKEPAPPFASVEIEDVDDDQVTMGPAGRRKFEHLAFFDVKLYGPAGAGRGSTDQIAQYVVELFGSTTIGAIDDDERGIRTYTPVGKVIRDDKEFPDLWCYRVRVPFEFYERR